MSPTAESAQALIKSWQDQADEMFALSTQIRTALSNLNAVARCGPVQLQVTVSGALGAVGFAEDFADVSLPHLATSILDAHQAGLDLLWQGTGEEDGRQRKIKVALSIEPDDRDFDIEMTDIEAVPGLPTLPYSATSQSVDGDRPQYDPATDGDYNEWVRADMERIVAAASKIGEQIQQLTGRAVTQYLSIEVNHRGLPLSVQFRSAIARLDAEKAAQAFAEAYAQARAEIGSQTAEIMRR